MCYIPQGLGEINLLLFFFIPLCLQSRSTEGIRHGYFLTVGESVSHKFS